MKRKPKVIYDIHKNAINLPEPYDSAVGHYFEDTNIKHLDWSQVDQLKRDLITITLNLCDGNITQASVKLGMKRTTLVEIKNRMNL